MKQKTIIILFTYLWVKFSFAKDYFIQGNFSHGLLGLSLNVKEDNKTLINTKVQECINQDYLNTNSKFNSKRLGNC